MTVILTVSSLLLWDNSRASEEEENRAALRARLLQVESEVPPSLLTYLSETCPYAIVETLNKYNSPNHQSARGHYVSVLRMPPWVETGAGGTVYCVSLTDGWYRSTLGFYSVQRETCTLLWEKLYERPIIEPNMDTIRLGFEGANQLTVICDRNDLPLSHQSILLTGGGRRWSVAFDQWERDSRAKFVDLDGDGVLEVLYLVNMDNHQPIEERLFVYYADSVMYRYDPTQKVYDYEYNGNADALAHRIIETEHRRGLTDSHLVSAFASRLPRQVAAFLYRPTWSCWDDPPPRYINYLYLIDRSERRFAFCGASDGADLSYIAILEDVSGSWRRAWEMDIHRGFNSLAVDTIRLGIEFDGPPTLLAHSLETAYGGGDILLVYWNGDSAQVLLDGFLESPFSLWDFDGDGIQEIQGYSGDIRTDSGSHPVPVYEFNRADGSYHPVKDSVK